ncbi:MAG: glycosyl transferase family protein [uncultured bacterium]|nr:MAG: glycosyl transferase family protein [uncultured bacterium]
MDSLSPKIFVVILNFNGADTLLPCLASVFQSDYLNFEVVVVDNDSKDESFEKAKLQYSRAHFIKNSENLGFAKGNNVAIRFALEKFADYIFVLNNDTVIEKTTLSKLIESTETNKLAGIVSPLIMGPSDRDVWFAGGKIDWNKMRTSHLFEVQSPLPYPTQYIAGCAMLIKKEVFKKIGLFDERFFLYYEDADFSMRARNAGYELLIAPSAKIRHLEQSNSNNPAKIYWLVLSGCLFFNTHASFAWKLWLIPYLQLRKLKNFFNIIFSRNKNVAAVRQAYKDFKEIK